MDWNLQAVGAEAVRLWEFANDHFLTQAVRTPTSGRNIFDLVFATDEDLVSEVKVGLGLAGCDHCVVNFQVVTGTESEQPRFGHRLNLRRANYASFVRALQDTTLEPRPQSAKYEYIQSRFIHFKSQGGSSKVNPTWFNREIKAAIHRRKSLYVAARNEPSHEAQSLLTNQRRLVKRHVRQAKALEEQRVALACKDNPKEFYAYVNKHKVCKLLGPLQLETGELVSENREMAGVFNQYFSSVFTIEDGRLPALCHCV